VNAYKFRTTENFERVLDVLVNRRLYCSDVNSLNDVREADICVGNDRGREAELFQFGLLVTQAISEYRVCSVCATFDNHLLWAHYAGGSSGLAIEVIIPAADATEVNYDDEFIFLSDYIDAGVEAAARAALARKSKMWQYEKESRVITRNRLYDLSAPIPRVVVGSRMERSTVRALAQLCSDRGIRVERAVVADWGIYAVPLQNGAA
jgi:hypothetical protein